MSVFGDVGGESDNGAWYCRLLRLTPTPPMLTRDPEELDRGFGGGGGGGERCGFRCDRAVKVASDDDDDDDDDDEGSDTGGGGMNGSDEKKTATCDAAPGNGADAAPGNGADAAEEEGGGGGCDCGNPYAEREVGRG